MKNKMKCLLLSFLLLTGCNPAASSVSSISSVDSSVSSSREIQEHEMVEISQLPETVNGWMDTCTYVLLYKEENVWLKYTADFDFTYYFVVYTTASYHFSVYWEQNGDSIAEFDVSDETGNKIEYMVEKNGVEYVGDVQYHGYYEILLKKDQSIYFNLENLALENNQLACISVGRLKGDDTSAICIEKDLVRHTHTYGFSYEPYDNNQHKSFCWKDEEYVLEDHSFDSDGICKDCEYKKQN